MAAALLMLFQLQALAHDVALCPAPQRTLFECTTGRKVISVCGSPDLSVNAGFVQYRFGRPNAVELAYPAPDADWRQLTRAGGLMFSGGGGSYLVFARLPYRYIVYSAIGAGWGTKAGVVVEKNGKRIASVPCQGEARSELGPELFQQAAIAPDPGSFELP